MNAPPLSIERLSAGFDGAPVLDDVSFSIAAGRRAALLGPSGCGKTTLLRCIAGLASPRSGAITIGGRVVADARTHVAPSQRGVALVFQNYALWPHLTAREHVRLVARDAKSATTSAVAKAADDWLDRVRIGALHARLPSELSGGEQARLALARAFASGASLLLFDEPLRNLDPPLARELRGEIVRWIDEANATALFVTHDPNEAVELAHDAHVLLGNGKLGASGPPRELLDAPPSDAVARVLGLARARATTGAVA